jgi:hypothetical protein
MIVSGVSGDQNAPIMLNRESSRRFLSAIPTILTDEGAINLNNVCLYIRTARARNGVGGSVGQISDGKSGWHRPASP